MNKKILIVIGVLIVVFAVGVLAYKRVHPANGPSSPGIASATGGEDNQHQASGAPSDQGNHQWRQGGGSRQMPGAGSGQAGVAPGQPGQPGGRPNRMAALNLTPDQQKKMDAIRQDSQKKERALLTPAQQTLFDQMHAQRGPSGAGAGGPHRSALNLTPDQQKQMQAIREDSQKQQRAVLTPAQQAQFDQMRAQWGQGGRGGPGGPGGGMGGRPNPMAALNLTPDQQQKFDAIREASHAKRQALDADTTLSEADRQTQEQAIRQDSQQQQRALLTPAQQKLFDQIRAQWGQGGGRGGNRPGGAPGQAPPLGPR